MIGISVKGAGRQTAEFLQKLKRNDIFSELSRYGDMGVAALAAATPKDSGETATSWKYRVIRDKRKPGIEWYNTNVVDGQQIAILIQYGHGTGTGGYVPGRDYINPAIKPVMDAVVENVWKKVRQ